MESNKRDSNQDRDYLDSLHIILSDFPRNELLKLVEDKRNQLGLEVVDFRSASRIILRELGGSPFSMRTLWNDSLHTYRIGPTILPSDFDIESLKQLIETPFESARLEITTVTESYHEEDGDVTIETMDFMGELESLDAIAHITSQYLDIQENFVNLRHFNSTIEGWIRSKAHLDPQPAGTTLNWFLNELASFYPRYEPTTNPWVAGIGLLIGVKLDGDPIDIGNQLRIRQLNQLESSIVANSKPERLGWYHKAIKFGLESRQRSRPSCIVECVSTGEEHFELDSEIPVFTPSKREVVRMIQDTLICLSLLSEKVVSAEHMVFPTIRIALGPEYHPPISRMGLVGPLAISSQSSSPLRLNLVREEFLSIFQVLDEFHSLQRTKFHDDFERAIVRYLQSRREYYLEDVIVDLALTIEIITKTGIRAASTKLASFLAMGDESEEIQRIYSEFADLRNKVIHGSVAEKIENHLIVNKMSQIMQALLRNVLYYSVVREIPTGRHEFRDLLDACIVNSNRREEVQGTFPMWSVRNLSKSLGVELRKIS